MPEITHVNVEKKSRPPWESLLRLGPGGAWSETQQKLSGGISGSVKEYGKLSFEEESFDWKGMERGSYAVQFFYRYPEDAPGEDAWKGTILSNEVTFDVR